MAGMTMARTMPAAALYELGVACAVGAAGAGVDLVSAHKWFNLAALSGDPRATHDRADIADMLSASEIADALRQARLWLTATRH